MRDSRLRFRRRAAAPSPSRLAGVLLVLLGAGCSDPTAPTPPPVDPVVKVIAGAGATDTVQALLLQALVAEVRGTQGQPLRGMVVRFDVLPSEDTTRASESPATVGALGGAQTGATSADTTDAQGRAKALVRLGTIAGRARVLVFVPELGLHDTATFTVLPGRPRRFIVAVRDTAVHPGASYAIGAVPADRFLNRRAGDAVTYHPTSSAVSVDGSGKLTAGATPGRATVVLTAGAATDTAAVSVVPVGTLAVIRYAYPQAPSIMTLDLDGSGLRRLVAITTPQSTLSWSPDGSLIAYHEGDSFSFGQLYGVTTGGTRWLLLAPPAGLTSVFLPRFSADGLWIYFSARPAPSPYTYSSSYEAWRVSTDFTKVEQLVAQGFYVNNWQPSPSPDGTQMAFVSGTTISLLDLTTRAVRPLGVSGESPQYSPDGRLIAYFAMVGGQTFLAVMNADGSGARLVTLEHGYACCGFMAPSWTRDGEWLVVRGPTRLELVRVATGEIVPLPYSKDLYQPAVAY